MKIEEKKSGETAREYAYNTIRDNIISLELEPGAPFNDIEVSQQIGISRTPVREAVIQLSEESRIIQIFPQRGMRKMCIRDRYLPAEIIFIIKHTMIRMTYNILN